MKTEISQKLVLLNSYLGYDNTYYSPTEKAVLYVENDKYKRDYGTTKKLVPDYNFLVLVLQKLRGNGYHLIPDLVDSKASIIINGDSEPRYFSYSDSSNNYTLLERNVCVISDCITFCKNNP